MVALVKEALYLLSGLKLRPDLVCRGNSLVYLQGSLATTLKKRCMKGDVSKSLGSKFRRKRRSSKLFPTIGNVCVCAKAARAARMEELINLSEEARLMMSKNPLSAVVLFHTKEMGQLGTVVTKEIQTVL